MSQIIRIVCVENFENISLNRKLVPVDSIAPNLITRRALAVNCIQEMLCATFIRKEVWAKISLRGTYLK